LLETGGQKNGQILDEDMAARKLKKENIFFLQKIFFTSSRKHRAKARSKKHLTKDQKTRKINRPLGMPGQEKQ
jgi:hypothetical protein